MDSDFAALSCEAVDYRVDNGAGGLLVPGLRRGWVDPDDHKRAERLDAVDRARRCCREARRIADISLDLARDQQICRAIGGHGHKLDLVRIEGWIDRRLMSALGRRDDGDRHRKDSARNS